MKLEARSPLPSLTHRTGLGFLILFSFIDEEAEAHRVPLAVQPLSTLLVGLQLPGYYHSRHRAVRLPRSPQQLPRFLPQETSHRRKKAWDPPAELLQESHDPARTVPGPNSWPIAGDKAKSEETGQAWLPVPHAPIRGA